MSQTGSSHSDPMSSGRVPPSNEPTTSGQTAACSATRPRKPRSQNKWPTDKVTCQGINADGTPTDKEGLKRFRLLCGLIARQRVGINVKFENLDEAARQSLFDALLEYLDYPENLTPRQRKDAFRAAMKSIAKLHRTFKTTLANKFALQNVTPFQVHRHLEPNEWDLFVTSVHSEEFQAKSEEMKGLRRRITDNHRLGPEGYEGKKKGKWRKEDDAIAQTGSENPWTQFPGRSSSYLRARAAPTPPSGEITFSSEGTRRLADRVMELKEQASQGSYTGVREEDILSGALETPEHRGRVRGVSSSKGWKEGFGPEYEGMWKKKRLTSAERDEALRRSILNEVANRLQIAGIDVSLAFGPTLPPPALTGFKSSCASKEVEGPVASSVPVRSVQSPAMPSVEPDTIDLLEGPTPCSLVMKPGGYTIELARGVVLPGQTVCHTVPVGPDFAVVKPDVVWTNCRAHPLEIPIEDEVTTLGDALHQRIQWRRADILVPPLCGPCTGTTSGGPSTGRLPSTQPQTAKVTPQPNTPPMVGKNDQEIVGDKGVSRNIPQKRSPTKRNPPKKNTPKKNTPKEKAAQKKATGNAWSQMNPKFEYGKPMLSAEALANAGAATKKLHNYYMGVLMPRKIQDINVLVPDRYFHMGDNYLVVSMSDLYDLFNLSALDISLLRCVTL